MRLPRSLVGMALTLVAVILLWFANAAKVNEGVTNA